MEAFLFIHSWNFLSQFLSGQLPHFPILLANNSREENFIKSFRQALKGGASLLLVCSTWSC